MALTTVPKELQQQQDLLAGGVATANLADGVLSADGTGRAKMADGFVTPIKLSQKLTAGASQATTSGTANDFTGIPSWAQKITVLLRGISTNGSAELLVQIGSGSIQTSGYVATAAYAASANQAGAASSTAGFNVTNGNATQTISGVMTIVHMGSNVWIASYAGKVNTTVCAIGGGDVALGGALDRLRLTTTNGTDAFDAGSVNILYEG